MFLPCVPRLRPNNVRDRMNRPEQDPAGRTWRHPGRHQTASHRPQPAIHTYPPPAEEATAAPVPAPRQLRQAPVPAPRQLRQAALRRRSSSGRHPSLLRRRLSSGRHLTLLRRRSSSGRHPTLLRRRSSSGRHPSLLRRRSSSGRHPSLLRRRSSSGRHPNLLRRRLSSGRHPSLLRRRSSSGRHPSLLRRRSSSGRHPTLLRRRSSSGRHPTLLPGPCITIGFGTVAVRLNGPVKTLVLGILDDLLNRSAKHLTSGGLDGHQTDLRGGLCTLLQAPFRPPWVDDFLVVVWVTSGIRSFRGGVLSWSVFWFGLGLVLFHVFLCSMFVVCSLGCCVHLFSSTLCRPISSLQPLVSCPGVPRCLVNLFCI
ncbi:serine/arginine repetitive matrix protein 1-like isoform X1 [Phyllopteryx taeniolatus]|uniref:serine/arginine repetitive matrix protein 1-like isoform X1 n=1 Tax=Phyllopteryx taeniolatus TaxID=161469 RepID=UPI002AD3FBEB|nr:serine/arginine repetitive matrix protein 1-like isoform X1 [Phyllopteryx taeniolatus]XP_061620913.1 serine/arginine repetitive matrix protein 1-like isoform X1 [Phyllopteryx taeniolatus]XP_061620914.1 serine/arginine repetitive matrix protein 1-like isoform X1 [Phyllopteryx taeniolatus]XP_061620915.1 serine/arginine repetitive matrix protein 1-like isoform X1 [Phyllopteryx taeniolatus]XP_061620916.1 serine/arginine repetitive matrix protein 1-like isoform X1 [Phyllopteryx taeniolatus]XP_06